MHALMYNIFVVKKNYLFMKNQMSIMNVDSFTISMLLYQDAFLDVGVVVKNGKNICSKGLISCKMTCRSLLWLFDCKIILWMYLEQNWVEGSTKISIFYKNVDSLEIGAKVDMLPFHSYVESALCIIASWLDNMYAVMHPYMQLK